MKKYFLVTLICLFTVVVFGLVQDLYVNGDVGPYYRIQDAIDDSNNSSDWEINVIVRNMESGDSYQENISVSPIADYNFISLDGSLIKVKPLNQNIPLFDIVNPTGESNPGQVVIDKFSFNNDPYGLNNPGSLNQAAIKFDTEYLKVINCEFNTETNSQFVVDICIDEDGLAGNFDWNLLHVENCYFANRTADGNNFNSYNIKNIYTIPFELGVKLINCSFENTERAYDVNFLHTLEFDNCSFTSTDVYVGSPLINAEIYDWSSIKNSSTINIRYPLCLTTEHYAPDLYIENNEFYGCSKIYIENAQTFNNNIIHTDYSRYMPIKKIDIESDDVIHNTFYEVNTTNAVDIIFESNKIQNNLFSDNSNDITFGSTPHANIIANYFDSRFDTSNITNFTNNLNLKGVANFDYPQNRELALKWPCDAIGNGYDENFDDTSVAGLDIQLIQYEDDTPDMGAIPFDDDRKEYQHFVDGTSPHNWTGFPVIDPDNTSTVVYNGTTHYSVPNNHMTIYFEDFKTDDFYPQYPTIDFQQGGSYTFGDYDFTYLSSGYNSNEKVDERWGYQVEAPDEMDSWFSGLLQDPDQEFDLPVTSEKIWLGFFGENPTYWENAFGPYLTNLSFIQHKDWSFYKTSGGNWVGRVSGNTDCKLRMGDFVLVKYASGVQSIMDFHWNYDTPSRTEAYTYKQAESVTFTEQADYTPIFVDVEPNSDINELVVYAGDDCVGGVKVDDEATVMVQAFIEDVPQDTPLTIVTINGSKSAKILENVVSYDNVLQVWDKIQELKVNNQDFYHVSMTKDATELLETQQIISTNYPNPFNPETNIQFNNPQAGEVTVDIYNLKGQLVKNLVNRDMDQGIHKIVWNGSNNANKSSASGVYFYKIRSGNATATKKIILMK